MQPLVWLELAWHDIAGTRRLSLAHGLLLTLPGAAITAVGHDRYWLLAGALSGFLLLSPVLATSLYALSRALERSEPASAAVVLKTWLSWQGSHINKWGNDCWCMVQFGALLALAATGWVLTSATLITLFAPVPIHTPVDFVNHVVLAKTGWLFEAWLALGGVMAAPIFASSVVVMPLLLDRRVTLSQAVLTSWQAVLCNPLAMGVWAALTVGFTEEQIAASGLTFGLGAFKLYMLFIIGHLAWEAKADKLGTFVLFIAPGFGVLGFVAKLVVQWIFSRQT